MIRKILVFALGMIFVSAYSFAETQTSVNGTDFYPDDVLNVQSAVDDYDIVFLIGIFDFGTDGSVVIDKDVRIFGETDNQGNPLTIINGGERTFHSPLPLGYAPGGGPEITIEGINFEGATQTPILINYSRGATIVGNNISNLSPVPYPTNPAFGTSSGIRVDGSTAGVYEEGAVTGNFDIIYNEIDMSCSDPALTIASGVRFYNTTNANANIVQNVVTNVPRVGLEALNNYLNGDNGGIILFEKNQVVTSTLGVPFPTFLAPDGIGCGKFNAVPSLSLGRCVISNNQIELNGINLGSAGVFTLADGIIIEKNNILSNSSNVRGIVLFSSDCLVTANKLEGSGYAAIVVSPALGPATDNLLLANNLDNFSGIVADVIFATGGNTLVGGSGTVLNLGVNTIKGSFSVENTPGGVGEEISDAMRMRP